MDGRRDANPAGFDTKIMRNCGKIHLKRTKLDLLINRLVIMVSGPGPLPRGDGAPTEAPPPSSRPVSPLQKVRPDPTDRSVGQRIFS